MALSGKSANVYITSSVATTALAQAFTAVAGSSVAYQITSTSARHWDRNPSNSARPRMLYNGSTGTVPSYTVDHVRGIVTFASTTSATVTGDVEYLTASSVAEGRSWQLNIDRDLFEVSTFDSSGWRDYQQNMNGASISIERYAQSSTAAQFFDMMNVDQDLVVEMYPDEAAGDRYEAYGFITADQLAASVDGIISESIDITVDGAVYWTTSA